MKPLVLVLLLSTIVLPFDLENMATNRWYSIEPVWDFLPSVENAPDAKYQNRGWCNAVTNPNGGVLFYEGFYDENRGSSIYANTLYNFNPVSDVCSMLTVNENNPIKRHTYNQFCYAASTNSVYMVSGAHRGAVDDAWGYSLTTGQWTKISDNIGGSSYYHDLPFMWDPATNRLIWFRKIGEPVVYNINTSVWSALPTPANYNDIDFNGSGNAFDTRRNRMILFGGYWRHPSNTLRFYYPAQNRYEVLNVSGPKPPTASADPHPPYSNIAYMANSDKYLTTELGQTWIFDPVSATWTRMQPNGPTPPDFGMKMAYDSVNNVIVGIQNSSFDATFWIYRYDNSSAAADGRTPDAGHAGLTVSPNPFFGSTSIKLGAGLKIEDLRIMIYDISGKLVADLLQQRTWQPTGLPSGLYIARIKTGNRVFKKHLTLL